MVSARNMNVQITQVVHGASSAGRNSTAVRALRVTINEVAAHADVSRQTVSNTLNYPDRVRPATLQRVRESIDLLGYRPSAPSQQLRRQRSGAVGFELNALGSALNDVAHPFLVALSVATAQYGCHLVPFASGDARPALDGYIDTVQRHLVDAFVIVDTHPMDPRPAWLSQRAIPWVAFGRVWDDETLTRGSRRRRVGDCDRPARHRRDTRGGLRTRHRRGDCGGWTAPRLRRPRWRCRVRV